MLITSLYHRRIKTKWINTTTLKNNTLTVKSIRSVAEKDSILQRASNPDANGKKEKTQRQKNIIYLTVALLCIIAIAAIPVGTYFFTSPNSPLAKEEDGTSRL